MTKEEILKLIRSGEEGIASLWAGILGNSYRYIYDKKKWHVKAGSMYMVDFNDTLGRHGLPKLWDKLEEAVKGYEQEIKLNDKRKDEDGNHYERFLHYANARDAIKAAIHKMKSLSGQRNVTTLMRKYLP